MSFARDIALHAKHVDVALEEMARAVLFKANDLIIGRTPTDTGRARGGWIASLGNAATGEGHLGDPTGRANSVAGRAVGKVYYLANNVKYIGVLEYGGFPNPSKGSKTQGGYSELAPKGMLRISVQEIKKEIAKQVRQTRRGF